MNLKEIVEDEIIMFLFQRWRSFYFRQEKEGKRERDAQN